MLLLCTASAQIIPDSLRVNWSNAGYDGTIPEPSLIINVKDFGAFGDGVHDDYNAIVSAINSSTEFRVIFFPAGNYLIKSSITVPGNVVFRGEGIITNLIFDLSSSGKKHGFDISNIQTNAFTSIDSGYYRGSSVLKLAATSGFTADSFAEIREMNGAWNTVPIDWANYSVGQIVKIKTINGNRITIEPALRIDYTDTLYPEIRPVTLKTNVGIECLKITRADTIIKNKYGYNINFSYAANCWITGIESSKSQASHIMLASCKNISISGCYFHDAFTYDGTSTAGYGITMIQHNSDCKVENCILKHLRHSMVAKQGANGNVFAYNYSLDPNRSEDPYDAGGDMLLHGHYPFANLFEGNIGQSIIVDDTWGPAGPYNTFFRNRAELYGIIIFDQTVSSYNQNIVGNEVTNTDSLKGNYYLQPGYHFTYDNNINGIIQPPDANTLNDVSYYLTSKPYFWNISSVWPSIGGLNALNSGTNPARERYLLNENKTICLKEPATTLHISISADSIKCNGGFSHIIITAAGGVLPYNGTGDFYKPAGNYSFVVTDAFGYADTGKINIGQPVAIKVTAKTTNASSCKDDGTITVKKTGGVPPFTYSLNNEDYISTNIFYNLAGTYTAFVKDKTGCTNSLENINVKRAAALKVSIQKTNVSCKNGNDGTIIISARGGTQPYLYSKDSITYTSNNMFINLTHGTYKVWIKDARACIASSTVVIGNGKTTCSSATPLNIITNNELKVSVLPNPSTQKFILTINSNSKKEIQFIILDIYGRKLYSDHGSPAKFYEFGESLIPGVYILKFKQDSNSKIFKIVKQ